MIGHSVRRSVAALAAGIDPDFVTRIETTTSNEVFEWSFTNTGNYNATIDYGDGSPTQTINSYNDPNKAHTYAVAGIYTQRISGELGSLDMWGSPHQNKMLSFESMGDDVFTGGANNSANRDCTSLQYCAEGYVPRLSSLHRFFYGNSAVTYIKLHGLTDCYLFGAFTPCALLETLDLGEVVNGVLLTLDGNLLLREVLSSGTLSGSANNICRRLSNLEVFGPMDFSLTTRADTAFDGCSKLSVFPMTAAGSGTHLSAFRDCFLISSVPDGIDFSGATNCQTLFGDCVSLTDFPANAFDSCVATNYNGAFDNCALTQQSVDNILISVDIAGQSDGILGISGGTNSPPGPAGLTAKANLEARGWTVTTN